MAWPTPQDYNEAIQSPELCFSDVELRDGKPETTALGLPRPISGGFASVYRIRSKSRDYAVRCFLREFGDLRDRYAAISQHLQNTNLPYTANFEYVSQGILVRGRWYPILKMEWLQGEQLDQYIARNLSDKRALTRLSTEWIELVKDLRRSGIAHGDLQHGNVLVAANRLRIIDYDGMFVPSLSGRSSHEVGHRNYQHPGRKSSDYDLHIDHFSSWCIYISLVALSIDPSLGGHIGTGEEYLLFRREDFEHPEASRVFQTLAAIPVEHLRQMLGLMKSFLGMDLSRIPPLDPSRLPPAVRGVQGPPAWLKGFLPGGGQLKPNPPGPAISAGTPVERQESTPILLTGPWLLERLAVVGGVLLVLLPAQVTSDQMVRLLVVASTALIATSAVTLFLAFRFHRLPEVACRRDLIPRCTAAREAADLKQKQIWSRRATEDRRLQDERAGEEKAQAQMRSLTEQERAELDTAKRDLQAALMSIEKEKQGALQARESELHSALKARQDQLIYEELQQYALCAGCVHGIGEELVARLRAHGIRTAADISGVRKVRRPFGGGSDEIYLISSRGNLVNSVAVPGIGEVKASALLRWRKAKESRLQCRLPTELPPAERQGIAAKHQVKLDWAEQQRNAVQQTVRRRMQDIGQKYGRLRAEAQKEEKQMQEQGRQAQASFERALQNLQSDYTRQTAELARLERSAARYERVTIADYLKAILGLRRSG